MNKSKFIEELVKKSKLTKEECTKISEILENNFIIGKKNKEKIMKNFIEKLNFSEKKADEIYNVVSEIIANEIREKLKHPFKSLD